MADELHLSPAAHQRLQEEHRERTTARRKELSARIEEAREHGDLKENAEYHAAKDEQGHNEARIRQLEDLLKRAVIVEANSATDAVSPGCLVEIRMVGDDDTTTYLVGSIEERHASYDVLSPSSPLGVALLGHAAGDTVTYQSPRRELSVTVVSISTP
jgi:transcription elongation factor GreA